MSVQSKSYKLGVIRKLLDLEPENENRNEKSALHHAWGVMEGIARTKVHRTSVTHDVMRGRRANARPRGRGKVRG